VWRHPETPGTKDVGVLLAYRPHEKIEMLGEPSHRSARDHQHDHLFAEEPSRAAGARLTGETDDEVRSYISPIIQRCLAGLLPAVAAACVLSTLVAASARADAVAYLVNVTVRPGYNFPNADAALAYGHDICNKVASGRGYADVISDVKADFATSDEYQAAYLINQAVNELCPALIWQLRNSAVHYRPSNP
jgi:hypothetical protein